MVHAEALHLVQRNEHSGEEQFVFLFQRQREPVDDGAENLEKFGNAIESLGLVNELEKDIVDGAANVRAKIEEFSVDAMQGGFEEIPFPGVFRVEQFQQLVEFSQGRSAARQGDYLHSAQSYDLYTPWQCSC